MTHRILLTTVAVTMMAASAASAQSPKSSSTPQQPKPAAQQPKSSPKMVHTTKSTRTVETPRKVELKEAQPGLISQATYSLDNALATAQKTYSGTVVSERIEKRGDQLVYVFGIRGRHKVRHVMIDAKSGSVVKPQAHARKHTESRKEK